MRMLYLGVDVRDGEYAVLEQPNGRLGVDKNGTLAVRNGLSRSASIFGLLKDMLGSCQEMLLILVGRYRGPEPDAGLYMDADVARLGWLMIPESKWTYSGDMAQAFMLDEYLSVFQDSQKHRSAPLDVVVANEPFVARRASLQVSSGRRLVPGVTRHESAYGPTGSVMDAWGRPGSSWLKAETMSAESLGQWHVFLSEDNLKNYRALFLRPTFSASVLRRLADRTAVIRNGVDFAMIERWMDADVPGWRTNDRGRTIGSFSRPTTQKGTPQTLELYASMLIAGQMDKAIVTWNRDTPIESAMPGGVPPQVEFHPNSDRRAYLGFAAQSIAAVFNSTNESSPICSVECASVGCVPVLPDRAWARAMAEPWPFMYRSWDDVPKMLLKIADEYESWRGFAMAYAKRNYDVIDRGPEFANHVRTIADEQNKFRTMSDQEFETWCADSKIAKSIDDLFAKRKRVKWSEVVKAVVMPRDMLGMPVVFTHHDLPALVERRTGFADDLTATTPTFTRR